MNKSIVAGQEAIRIMKPDAIAEAAARRRGRQRRERAIKGGLFFAALLSVAATVTIIAVLLSESVGFFRAVPLTDFLLIHSGLPSLPILTTGSCPCSPARLSPAGSVCSLRFLSVRWLRSISPNSPPLVCGKS